MWMSTDSVPYRIIERYTTTCKLFSNGLQGSGIVAIWPSSCFLYQCDGGFPSIVLFRGIEALAHPARFHLPPSIELSTLRFHNQSGRVRCGTWLMTSSTPEVNIFLIATQCSVQFESLVREWATLSGHLKYRKSLSKPALKYGGASPIC